jgi:hypothetical protein
MSSPGSERIDVDALFLANAAESQSGLLYVLGGAWTRCWPPEGHGYPYERGIPIVIIIRIPWGETNVQHIFRVEVNDDDHQPVIAPAKGEFRVGRPPDLTDGASQVLAITITPAVKLSRTGLYHIAVSVDDVELKAIEFEAIDRPAVRPSGRER